MRDILERGAAAAGLVIGSPVLLCVSAAIALEDGLPILFRQTRVGRHGKQFKLLKFRSMRTGVAGARITSGADNRITRTGRILRKYKLDELPQLWNVLKGDMGLIGPRPEVPPFVDLSDAAWIAVLAVRPGITDLATLLYRDEERLLAQAGNTEEFYRNTILPAKLALNRHYLQRRTWWLDLKIVLLSVWYSFVPSAYNPARVARTFSVENFHELRRLDSIPLAGNR